MVVHQLCTTKAPRPDDDSNGQFYQSYWKDIQWDVLKEMQRYFSSGQLNPELNRTHISLIPKIPHPEKMEHLHLISLCNFAYKIISKILANQLKPWLPELIAME